MHIFYKYKFYWNIVQKYTILYINFKTKYKIIYDILNKYFFPYRKKQKWFLRKNKKFIKKSFRKFNK